MKNSQLTAKQDRFCREYMIDCNGTQAAIRAGYSQKTACEQSCRLLANVRVKRRVAELQGKVARQLGVKAENVLQELAKVGFANIADYLSFGPDGVVLKSSEELLREQLAAVGEVQELQGAGGNTTIKFKLHDKLAALRDLGKHLKLFTDVTEVKDKSMAQVVSEMRKARIERERARAGVGSTGT